MYTVIAKEAHNEDRVFECVIHRSLFAQFV